MIGCRRLTVGRACHATLQVNSGPSSALRIAQRVTFTRTKSSGGRKGGASILALLAWASSTISSATTALNLEIRTTHIMTIISIAHKGGPLTTCAQKRMKNLPVVIRRVCLKNTDGAPMRFAKPTSSAHRERSPKSRVQPPVRRSASQSLRPVCAPVYLLGLH